jgi:hypothetical protein
MMKYSLVIDVQSYDEIGRETVHHHSVSLVNEDKEFLIGVARSVNELIDGFAMSLSLEYSKREGK